jgi:branched-subunit amino acid aminotransferase/4-amino-4-deoxychorismate lyase
MGVLQMKYLLIAITLLTASCSTTVSLLQSADYVCITGTIRGVITSTTVDGRGIKLPKGETLTPELAETLCI